MTDTTNPECNHVRGDFSALLDGELAPDERERIEDHLSDCAECLRALDKFKRVDVLYAQLESVHAPVGFERSVRLALEPKRTVRFPVRAVFGTMVAAAAAVALMITVWPREVIAPGDGSFQVSKAIEKSSVAARATENPPSQYLESASEGPAFTESSAAKARQAPIAEMPAVSQEAAFADAIEAAKPEGEAELDVAEPEVTMRRTEPAGDERHSQSVAEEDKEAPESRLRDAALNERAAAKSAASEGFDLGAARPEGQASESAVASAQPLDQSLRGADDDKLSATQLGGVAGRMDSPARADGERESLQASTLPAAAAPAPAKAKPESKDDAAGEARSVRVAVAPRTFEVRDGVWYESGYSGQAPIEIARDSESVRALIDRDPRVAALIENDARIVFRVDTIWYVLPAVR